MERGIDIYQDFLGSGLRKLAKDYFVVLALGQKFPAAFLNSFAWAK